MFEKILLPLDGSALSERSIPHAIEFARIFDSQILLLRILERETSQENQNPADPLQWQLLRSQSTFYLHDIANQIRKALDLPELEDETGTEGRVSVTVLEGKIAENIVDFAQKAQIDLMVICSHGSSGLSRWNMSSVISKVVNHIYKPVLIVRGYQAENLKEGRPGYERILVPLDGSRRSECALTAALVFARQIQSKLILTTVIKPLDVPTIEPFRHDLQQMSDDFMALKREAIRYYMDELTQRLALDFEVHITENPSVIRGITEMIKEKDADLLIFCAHGFTGDIHGPFGGIARSFIEYCTKPVLVIQDMPLNLSNSIRAEELAERSRSRE